MEEKETKTQVYELSFHLAPEIGDENVAKEFGDIKASIEAEGGVCFSEEMPTLIQLAYEIEKKIDNKKETYNKGYFGWIKFEMSAESLSALKIKLESMNTIVRFLLIKTVKESTLAPKKIVQKIDTSASGKRDKRTKDPIVPIDKEEVDREIDALVADEETTSEDVDHSSEQEEVVV
ncbi:MAG: 30S ribosomal protein S6 [Candidatus Pacebacteria bacterium]|nr:30S ribosomal protein S6 [Candidatus Paceibacterota bacterium]